MLMTLIQKEIMHHILSVRFVALLLMCALLIPLTLSINYRRYSQNVTDYQESVKRTRTEAKENPPNASDPNVEVSKFFLKPTPLSVFANGLEEALPTYLGMTRNGVRQGSAGVSQASVAYALGNLDFLFIVGTVFSLLALLFTFDAVAGEKEAGTLRINLSNPLPRDVFLWSKLIGGYIVFVVPFLVSFLLGLLLIVWQGFPLGETQCCAASAGPDACRAALYCGLLRNRCRNFNVSRQLQDCPDCRIYVLGVCSADCAERRVCRRETRRTHPDPADCLYGENRTSQQPDKR